MEHIKKRYPSDPVIAFGSSVAAFKLTRYLIKTGTNSLIDAALFVSPVWRYKSFLDSLDLFYNYFDKKIIFTKRVNFIKENIELVGQELNMSTISGAKTVVELESYLIERGHVFDSPADYFNDANNFDKLQLIQKPVLCICSKDDYLSSLKGELSKLFQLVLNIFIRTTLG